MNTVKSLFRLLLILIVLPMIGLASAKIERDPDAHFFEMTFGDFSEELIRAKQENKKGILLFFETDDCPFCFRMRTTVLNQPKVQAYFRRHFLLFAVDMEGQTEIINFKGESKTAKDFSEKEHRVRGTPTIAFFNLKGQRITRYIGATSGIEEFMWLGRYVVDGHYKKIPFVKFKRQQKKK